MNLEQRRLGLLSKWLFVVALLFLLILGAFQTAWVLAGSETSIMLQCGLQRTRAQAIAKDVLILSYRPGDEHAQAVSEIQATLPRFEQAERGLLVGDASLQLPSHVPGDIAQVMVGAAPDYVAMDIALRSIIAHTDAPIDLIQRDIVLAHIDGYSTTMMQVETLWQQHIDNGFLFLFWIESALTGILVLLVIAKYFFGVRQLLRIIERGASAA